MTSIENNFYEIRISLPIGSKEAEDMYGPSAYLARIDRSESGREQARPVRLRTAIQSTGVHSHTGGVFTLDEVPNLLFAYLIIIGAPERYCLPEFRLTRH